MTLQNLSFRLKHALQVLRISQAELARRLNIKQQAINYLCCSNATKSKFTYQIAEALQINPQWLATGVGNMYLEVEKNEHNIINFKYKVPCVAWNDLTSSCLSLLNNPEQWQITNYIMTNINFTENQKIIATKIIDNAMFPRFDTNTSIIIELNANKICNKDFVLVYLIKFDIIILRQYFQCLPQDKLITFNNELYRPIMVDEQVKILGVVRESHWHN